MSIMDMLPEHETPLPRGCGTGRKMEKCICLRERACAHCGKAFTYRLGQTAYTRKVKSKTLRFCSWSCKCADERERKTAKPGGCTKTIEERIEERVMKMVKDRALLDSEAGELLPKKEKQRLVNRLQRLHKEVKALMEIQEYENSGSVRGIAGGDDRAAQAGP